MLSSEISLTESKPGEKRRCEQEQRLGLTSTAVHTCIVMAGSTWGTASAGAGIEKPEVGTRAVLVPSTLCQLSGEGKESATLGLSKAAPDR